VNYVTKKKYDTLKENKVNKITNFCYRLRKISTSTVKFGYNGKAYNVIGALASKNKPTLLAPSNYINIQGFNCGSHSYN